MNEDYFINKFEAIPDELWGMGALCTDYEHGVKCAMGHCGMTIPAVKTPEADALQKLFDKYLQVDVITLNDGCCPIILQEKGLYQNGPKERILSALYKIKESKRTKETKLQIVDNLIASAMIIEEAEYEVIS